MKQQGAALVIVMALLAGAMTLGLSGMQTALVDERLAGNYRAATLAQMAAESGAIVRGEKNATNESDVSCGALKESVQRNAAASANFSKFNAIESAAGNSNVVAGYYFAECQNAGKSSELIVGQVKRNADVSVNEFIAVDYYVLYPNASGGSGSSPGEGGGGNNSFGSGAVVAGKGGVRLTGSARVSGGITTSGDVEIKGGASVPDSIDAAGTIDSPNYWDEDDTKNFRENVSFDSVRQDPLSIEDVYASLDRKTEALKEGPYEYGDVRVGRYPLVDATISGNGLIGFNESKNPGENQVMVEAEDYDVSEVPMITGNYPVMRTRDFNQTNGSLTVTGNAVLIVDGDLTLGGGGDEGLIFAGDSSLTVLVTGDVDLKSSLQMQNLSVKTQSGQPRFAVYSLGENVKITGNSQAMAMIYAPFASVDIRGSGGLRGALWGESVDVRGAGRIIGEGSFIDGSSSATDGAGSSAWAPF
ncbi:Tfp pilus assembly protein PilX [Vreelandella subterranea]|uniref:Tfp pilus assembly protein PilX n=1 Tax=Vreelandella subterranea TaxID=416874 RepID=A0A1H9NZM5_9GAMM|nr:PilX N-terminal domain-containing pilus assembly protein [Halomonas subterranea]SER41378.1 Tfp pilus assembly protein PilX [Halomonas subterranea]